MTGLATRPLGGDAMIVANDWTGTAAQRHEQGGCVNYGTYPGKLYRWLIPAGTTVSVCRVNDSSRKWMPYTTKIDVPFNKNEGGRSGAVVVRYEGWLILTRWKNIRNSR